MEESTPGLNKSVTFTLEFNDQWFCNPNILDCIETWSEPKRVKDGWEYTIKLKDNVGFQR